MTVAIIYPECARRGCWWSFWLDQRRPEIGHFQHGENPESVLEVSMPEPVHATRALVAEWVERCHRYDDGELA